MKVAVVSSTSGSGKTTVARSLAHRFDVPYVELDALVHGPGWVETPDEALLAQVAPVVATDGWVIDGGYWHKLGHLVVDAADVVVWLDLPVRVWLPRLLRRTWRRVRGREELWNGNRETFRTAFWGRESLLAWAFRSYVHRRREWPAALAELPVVRLRTPAEVDRFLSDPVVWSSTSSS